jgi:hypothetical protein
MGKVAASTGGVGDIIYGIPIMRRLKVDKIFIKENFYYPPYGSMYTALKPLLHTQGIEAFPTKGGLPFNVYEGISFDYDLDKFRYHGTRGVMHIIKSMCLACRLAPVDWNVPFIKGFSCYHGNYFVIHLTQRWREGSKVKWKNVYDSLRLSGIKVFFCGFPEDHEIFCKEYGDIEFKHTENLLELTYFISGANALYCNQGVALTIAQGLGKEYYCDFKMHKTNTRFYTKNEHNLNV